MHFHGVECSRPLRKTSFRAEQVLPARCWRRQPGCIASLPEQMVNGNGSHEYVVGCIEPNTWFPSPEAVNLGHTWNRGTESLKRWSLALSRPRLTVTVTTLFYSDSFYVEDLADLHFEDAAAIATGFVFRSLSGSFS
jgi:hypothetical protein